MMRIHSLILGISLPLVATLSFVGGRVDIAAPGYVTIQQAEARAYRRSVRRTSRRTSQRTAARHSGAYYGASAVGAAAVTAIAIGTVVATLPPACTTVRVGGAVYHECGGVYYRPRGSQWVVVEAP